MVVNFSFVCLFVCLFVFMPFFNWITQYENEMAHKSILKRPMCSLWMLIKTAIATFWNVSLIFPLPPKGHPMLCALSAGCKQHLAVSLRMVTQLGLVCLVTSQVVRRDGQKNHPRPRDKAACNVASVIPKCRAMRISNFPNQRQQSDNSCSLF